MAYPQPLGQGDKSLKRQGKLPDDKHTKFIAFGGDGGTYDIGLQSLSGAMEYVYLLHTY